MTRWVFDVVVGPFEGAVHHMTAERRAEDLLVVSRLPNSLLPFAFSGMHSAPCPKAAKCYGA